ncbi:MAG TPA: homoserine O-acetyltransferase [Candidatus Tumulicola sp.]|nr:homoserine O-acetyltransferase [Candidatus Tumulicola sp.]
MTLARTALTPRDETVRIEPPEGFALRHGGVLPYVDIACSMYGRTADEAPVVLVCHALTGSSRAAEWWGDLIGSGLLLDTDRYCVACCNALGGCYGSTGPASLAPDGVRWGRRFPVVTVEDMVRAQHDTLRRLGVNRIAVAIGGSLGGMQALQWGAAYPSAVSGVVSVGATGRMSPMAIGLNSAARAAVRIEGRAGLRVARMIGMLSYKSAALLWQRHGRRGNRGAEDPGSALDARFDVEGYLEHQGDKLAARLDPDSFLYLTKAMDLFDLDPAGWRVPALLVGISSDWLYPVEEVKATAASLGPSADYVEFQSDHGHDGFLADAAQLSAIVRPFLEERALDDAAAGQKVDDD